MAAPCYLAPDPLNSTQFIPGGAVPASGGQIFTYTNLTTNKVTVYKDSGSVTPWSNPIVLDSGGNLPSGGQIWIPQGVTLTAVFAPATDIDPPQSPYWTKNGFVGLNDPTTITGYEWIAGTTPTFVSATGLTVTGDQTAIYTLGRRLKTINTAGTRYLTVTSSVFATGSTNVGAASSVGYMDVGLSAVSYGLLNPVGGSVPALTARSGYPLFEDITDNTKMLAFDLSGIAASTVRSVSFPDADGTLALSGNLAYSTGSNGIRLPANYLQGFALTNSASSDAMNIGAGQAIDATSSSNIIGSVLNRKTIAAFAAGASSGAKLSGAAMSTNCWYAWYALGGSSGAYDAGFDLAFPPGVPTTSAAFPYYRYIGGRKTTASTAVWEQFVQDGNRVQWKLPPAYDLNGATGTATRTLTTMNIPPVRVEWLGNVILGDIVGSIYVYLSDPSIADAPAGTSAAYTLELSNGNAAVISVAAQARCYANASSQIGIRASVASTVIVGTLGWNDPRGSL